jgi:dTDP-4-amino-4,6-dideoxygalactose transaminase
MDRLAMFGGATVVDRDVARSAEVAWPVVRDGDRAAVMRTLAGGHFTSLAVDGEVQRFEREWAAFVGVPHCAAVSNGTAALELAIAAAGIEPGAEIVVPALSFIASATAPLQRLVVPVFADIDPTHYTLDAGAVAGAITSRTAAVLAVHLHGLPCDMAELRALADRHGLLLIEDAAQAHGATYGGRRTGSLGDIAAFSLNPSKNLPTCGEGGMVTTGDAPMHDRVVLHRQFGEKLTVPSARDYLSRVVAGNEKIGALEAAFARSQLARFESESVTRNANVAGFLDLLTGLPGLRLPTCPPGRTHAWHILRFAIEPGAMGCPDVSAGALRAVLQRALRAEGVPVQPYQRVPLPAQPAFRERGGPHWKLLGTDLPRYRPEDCPVAAAVVDGTFTLQRWHLNPAAGPVLHRCADAFHKVWEHRDRLIEIARRTEYRPAWQQAGVLSG